MSPEAKSRRRPRDPECPHFAAQHGRFLRYCSAIAPQAFSDAVCAVRSVEAITFRFGYASTSSSKHLAVALTGNSSKSLSHTFDLDAEHGGKILFIAEEDIHLAHQFTVHFLRSGLPPIDFQSDSR